MSFASLQFAVFMVVVYALYRVLNHRLQNRMLLIASYVFYGAWDWRFLGLILISTLVDYAVGLGLRDTEDTRRRKALLALSVCTNLGILGLFKYFNFFAESLVELAAMLGMDVSWTTLRIVLPVGISFYTFQTMSYTVDVYYRKLEPTTRFLDFALFVAFFPQLVAGPIERAANLLPRIFRPRTITLDQTTRGAFLVLFGLFKKVVIADGVAPSVDAVFGSTGAVSSLDVAVATWLFAIQIYCDFSGYSDIARGIAKLLGFDLMTNFDLPYVSTNPSEFWRRWHISLSSWLRDYLYVPLGGNRQGARKTYRNLMATMVLGGVWHGAAWNFVLWGLYQGGILCVHRPFAQRGGAEMVSRSLASVGLWFVKAFVFFQIVCYGWLLFRAQSFEQIQQFTRKLFLFPWETALHVPTPPLAALAGLAILAVLDTAQFLTRDVHFYRRWPAPIRGGLYALLFFVFLMGLSNETVQFVYFQF